jgi:L-galactose dehydrogenase
MKYRLLGHTGLSVSILSFGASSLGSVFREVDETEGIRTVHEALDLGINLFDVSPYYGLTKAEAVLGKALSGISRDRFILSTKAGRYGDAEFDFTSERLIRSVDESLQRLKLDYIDMLHLHDIEFADMNQIVEESIPSLVKLKEQGKIRFYGVSGLPLKIYKLVLDQVHLDTMITYCHYSINDTSLLEMLPYLEEKKIGIINASPLSMGLLTVRGTPTWHPALPEIKEICMKTVQHCEENGIDLAQLAIQFSIQNERIPTTLVGTASPENIRKNIRWIEEPLDLESLREVREMLFPIQNKTWLSGRLENN